MSTNDASRLCADPIACASPVKCILISSSGITLDFPPPVPPPFIPKTGPKDGSLKLVTADFPSLFNPCVNPIAVVVFPSPALVGVIPVTTINLPLPGFSLINSNGIFAL